MLHLGWVLGALLCFLSSTRCSYSPPLIPEWKISLCFIKFTNRLTNGAFLEHQLVGCCENEWFMGSKHIHSHIWNIFFSWFGVVVVALWLLIIGSIHFWKVVNERQCGMFFIVLAFYFWRVDNWRYPWASQSIG